MIRSALLVLGLALPLAACAGRAPVTRYCNLAPPARTGGGSRRYSEEDIARLRRIQELTNEGLNLAGVRMVLELEARVAELEERLDTLRRSLAEDGEASVTTLMQQLFKERSWGPMATSETYAHLEHLRLAGEVDRREVADGDADAAEGRLRYSLR